MDKKQLVEELIKRKKREAYKDDFQSFCEDHIKILPKDPTRGFIPFELNEAQQIVNDAVEKQRKETGKVRCIILKGRQQGLSTYCSARVFWVTYFTAFTRSVILAHDLMTTNALLDMGKNLMERLDNDFKPKFSISNSREIKFEGTESSYKIYTANSPEAGRGTTPTVLHASEVGFWLHDSKILAGLFNGLSGADGTEVFLESTANGADGEFHRMFWDAWNGNSEYIAVFIPWFKTSEYSNENYPSDFEDMLEPEEKELIEEYDLSLGQLYWRRLKIAEIGARNFLQEYPSKPEEAFLTSGNYVFDQDKLNQIIPHPPQYKRRYDEYSRYFDENPHGELSIWVPPDRQESYIIGADVSQGVGQDYSTAVVLNRNREVCALYRHNRVDPSSYGDLLADLGRYYNNALLAVESNSIGLATLNRLVHVDYVNLYYQTKINKLETSEGSQPGFRTSVASKPLIIGNLQRAIIDEDIEIPSKDIVAELKVYISKENGGTEAIKGHHDDCVMSLAIALEALRTHADKLTNTRVPWKHKSSWVNNTEDNWL